jgi:hypothetical protein
LVEDRNMFHRPTPSRAAPVGQSTRVAEQREAIRCPSLDKQTPASWGVPA